MGGSQSLVNIVEDLPDREVFICLLQHDKVSGYVVFRFIVKFRRFKFEIEKRFHELQTFDKKLRRAYPAEMASIKKPPRYSKFIYTHDAKFLEDRGKTLCAYLQTICDNKTVFHGALMKKFLNLGGTSFVPELGRKGKEGWLTKCSGGYVMRFSRRPGDYLNYWRERWFVLHDNYIAWYRTMADTEPRGILQLDASLNIVLIGRVLSIHTNTRKLTVSAKTRRSAEEWVRALNTFYKNTARRMTLSYGSSFPPRVRTDVRVYTYSKDYMAAAAVAMLGSQKEILICSWKNSPCVLLTRPPMPPLRLDQILRYKAEQGVKIHILLYKEVEMAGQGNDSGKAQNYLESLHPNIQCIRHPNKFVGGSTAVLWSHHEKLVVVDRNVAFVGGIDLAFNRWDNEEHRVEDEDGVLFPGRDYRQPAEGMFKPVRVSSALRSLTENAFQRKSSKGTGPLVKDTSNVVVMQDEFANQTIVLSKEEQSYQEKQAMQAADENVPNAPIDFNRKESFNDNASIADNTPSCSDDEPNKNEDRFEAFSPEELAVCDVARVKCITSLMILVLIF